MKWIVTYLTETQIYSFSDFDDILINFIIKFGEKFDDLNLFHVQPV